MQTTPTTLFSRVARHVVQVVCCLSAGIATLPAYAAPVADPLAYGAAAPANAAVAAPVPGQHGMAVSAQKLASEVGARILAKGGNAADAAVAMGYALAVVYPAAGNLGGGGFMMLRPPGKPAIFFDFREKAPLAATPDMFLDSKGNVIPDLSLLGWKAVAVPGTVAGLEAVHKRWGHLPRAVVMAPAIQLARDGFVLGEGDVQLLNTSTAALAQDPYARKVFLRPDGSPFQPGDRLVQKNLAHSLELIAQNGADAFYKGPIAASILEQSKAHGGILQAKDFEHYQPRELPPISCTYRGLLVETAPPPSAGGIALCEMLEILAGYDMHALGLHTAPALQREIEAMRHAYSDRRDLGDPAFVHNPVSSLLDPAYIASIRAHIPPNRAIPSADLRAGVASPEKPETTQFSVIDQNGFAISTTYTLNGWFGAKVMAGDTGIIMNDEMDDFSIKPGALNMFGIPGSAANAIAPGKTPLSSMAPTIISRDNRPVMVIGSPGGSRIPTIILSVILGVVDYGLNIQQAIDLPRLHEQWMPQSVEVEANALTPQVQQTLEQEGYSFVLHAPWGIPEGILVGGPGLNSHGPARFYGGADHRHPGGAAIGE
ncbi:MAG: gamma-glutamyltransferase [Acetobacter fabarum]|jgi:gamma-glutamyltranspeptidase/glutathione hydrolase|nr:gamma-glutamyltransferase [Acetobacter fabarum]MCI1909652.1 gamma-glutamyltransferase [Acetobacter fabarum]MCI1928201.1 gamma-glutamyltransferase [Acetobacter fabarum]MCI1948172.1 gamma-glutamyltransferase [Acetobacter fabarum]MCI1989157.1 gamma-glutamyltransferase [Acetobacter fabarum]